MFQQQVYIINTVMMVLDALCIYAAGYGAFYIRYFRYEGLWQMDDYTFTAPLVVVVFLNNYVMGNLGLYSDKRPPSVTFLTWTLFKAVVIDFMALSAIIFFYRRFGYSREFLLLFGTLSFVFISLLRIIERWYIHNISRSFNARRVLVVGDTEKGNIVRNLLEQQLSWGHDVVGRLTVREEASSADVLGTIENLPTILREHAIDEVVFALSDEDRAVSLAAYLELCKKMGITVKILPSLWKSNDRIVSVEIYQKVPFLTIKTDNFNATGLLYKRVLDLIGGVVGTLLFFIMYPFIAVAIKRDSEGPVIFRQKRVGQNGRIFHLYKFRTMYLDAEQRKQELLKKNEMQGFIFKLKDDPRITPLGKWLRKTSLDEFPQFLNVLKGEMSLVGTRPPTLDEVEKYEPQHLRRISAKPGITGLWQISGRNVITDFNEIVKLDCKYLDDWRFFDDVKILLKTILVVMQRKGAI
jgi:exopolysaccharide biosynthesis polyprenyl glycosylphosphotransferase